jgi:hypothetical protein
MSTKGGPVDLPAGVVALRCCRPQVLVVTTGSHPRGKWEALVHGLSDLHLMIYIFVLFAVSVACCPVNATKAAKAVPGAGQIASAALHDASEQHTGARISVSEQNCLCLEHALVVRYMVGSCIVKVYMIATPHVISRFTLTLRDQICADVVHVDST